MKKLRHLVPSDKPISVLGPGLTEEEFIFFQKVDREFFRRYNLAYPYGKKIASALQTLATAKLSGNGYWGIYEVNREESLQHHLKACAYDKTIPERHPKYIKAIG